MQAKDFMYLNNQEEVVESVPLEIEHVLLEHAIKIVEWIRI